MYKVYFISLNDKVVYIGSTKKKLFHRWLAHQAPSHSDRPLGKLISKHGKDAFKYETIQDDIPNKKTAREIEAAATHLWHPECNINYGDRHSDTSKTNLSVSHTGKKLSEEHKRSISFTNKGKASWNKGKTFSKEVRHNMSLAKTGVRHTEETKNKLSILNTGEKHPQYRTDVWQHTDVIRAEYATGETTYLKLGKKYNVSHTTIKRIVKFI